MRAALFSIALLTLSGGVGFPTLLNASQGILSSKTEPVISSDAPRFSDNTPYWECSRPKKMEMEREERLTRAVYGRVV